MSSGLIELLALLEMLSRGGGGASAPGTPVPTVAPGVPPPFAVPPVAPPPFAMPPPFVAPTPPLVPPEATVPLPPPPPVVPTSFPTVVVPPEAPLPPGPLPPMPPWPPGPVPSTLPPFPGAGWTPDTPVTPAVAARAAYWNPQLWNYPTKTIVHPMVQEQFGGQWVTFAAAWHPGSAGPQTYMATEAWRLASAPPIAPPVPVAPTPSAPMAKPGPVGAYPGPGAYQSNAPYIGRYQAALTWLAQTTGHPTWDPQGIDTKFGPKTQAAVKAFQSSYGITPVDGYCGAVTASALDQALGYAPSPVAVPSPSPTAATSPVVPIPVATPASGPPPPPVGPYPAAGAYKTNAPYIGRYQRALTWLAQATGHPAWDPQGVDSKFGPHTQAAVKAFQVSQGLPADGYCGGATAAALDALLAHAQSAAA